MLETVEKTGGYAPLEKHHDGLGRDTTLGRNFSKDVVLIGNNSDPDQIVKDRLFQVTGAVSIAKDGQQGIGRWLARTYRDNLRYDRSCNQWYMYESPVWKPDICGNAFRLFDGLRSALSEASVIIRYELKKEYSAGKYSTERGKQGIYEGTFSKALRPFASGENPELENLTTLLLKTRQELTQTAYRRECLNFAKQGDEDHEGLSIDGTQWNRNDNLVGCLNGILDLSTGELRTGTPEDFISYQAPVNYNPKAECPTFEKFVREILDADDELYYFVRRLFGLCLLGDGKQKERIVIMHGRGRNGKGTLMDIIHYVLGNDYAGKIDPSLLLGHKDKTAKAGVELHSLKDKRLVYTEESNEGAKLNSASVKQITGGSQLLGRALYSSPTLFTSRLMLFFETNSLPELSSSDYGLDQRMIRLDFPFSYVENPVRPFEKKLDPSLPATLRSEAEGIFNWMVRGYADYLGRGRKLDIPKAIEDLNEEYSKDFDTVSYYLEKYCTIGDGLRVSSAELYANYEMHMRNDDKEKLGKQTFFRELKDRKFERRMDGYGTMCFYRISIK